MSVIQRIRDKAAWLIFGAIALAMIGFIVTDAFQGRGRGLFGGQNTTYGKVDGTKIDYLEYQKRLKVIEDQNRGQQNDYMRQQTADNLWNQMIEQIVYGKVYNKLGIDITDKELGDLLYGPHPTEQLRQTFTNPQTGQYDASAAYQQIQEIKKRSPQVYEYFIESMIQNREREKYASLLTNTIYVPKWMAEKTSTDNTLIASISYVQIPYTTVSDSAVKVSDDEIKDYVQKHQQEYRQEKSRSISYVAFSAAPSAADSAAVRERLKNLSSEFATTTDLKGFLLRSNSEIPYYEGFISKGKIQVPFKDSIFNTPVGGIYGPYLDGSNYVLAKVVDRKQLPDTVKVRHILIATHQMDPQTRQLYPIREDSTAKRIVDSVQLALRNGVSFDSLVVKYSDDDGSKKKGGVYDSISTMQMAPAFNDFIFTNPTGTKGVVKTEYGYHYVEVLAQRGSASAYKIAYLANPIITSQETENTASGLASQFAAQSRTSKEFNDNAAKQNLQKLIVSDVHAGDYNVGDLGASREFVRWIYEADKGDIVEQPYAVGDKYVVAELTEINDEGVMSPQKARPLVEGIIKNRKKAEMIIQKVGTPNSLEAVATANKLQVLRADSVGFAAQFIPNVGRELKLIGGAFNKQLQGKVSVPFEGNAGVFVMKPESVSAKPNLNASIEGLRASLEQQVNAQAYRSLDVIKRNAKIKDYREKF